MPNHEQDMVKTPTRTKRISRNCTALVINSTLQDHQLPAESTALMSCDLSIINNSVMPLKRVNDTPAKVFARLKAKIQRQNSEELREVNGIPRQLGRSVLLSTNMQQPPVDDGTSEQQDTYVLTLSPPNSASKISELEDPQMTLLDGEGGYNPDMVHKPVALEKMLTETFTQVKMQPKKTVKTSTNKSTGIIQDAYVFLERMPEDLPAQPGPAKPIQSIISIKNRNAYVLLERMPEDLTAQQGPANPMQSMISIKNRSGVFGEVIVMDDSEGAVDDRNRMDKGLDITAQSQPEPQRPEKMSNRQYENLEALAQALPNLMEDSLLQLSPRIAIPRKQMAAVRTKQQTKEMDKTLDGKTNVNEIHLRDWVLKLHNRELVVDGIRKDNNIPWHSSCITERVSSNLVKTSSGGTYVLVGKMSHYYSSSFPSWFRKKFLFGFPEMWKEYLNKFLADNDGSRKNRPRNNSAPCEPQKKWPSKKQISKQLKSKELVTPDGSAGSVPPHSAPVSRSGRLIKPPLEYWRGGRITVGPDMNVTVHEDYTSTSILLTPKTRPVVILKSLKLPEKQSVYKSPVTEMQNSSEEDTLAPRRRVKQHKSWRTDGTKAWENASQKKSLDAVFNSDSGSEKAAAAPKQPSPQQAQSEQVYLRRGRSYSRERNSTGSESEGSRFGVYCAEGGVSAILSPEGKIKARLNRKYLQSVIQTEKHSTPYTDSGTSSAQYQVQKSADSDHLFTPLDPMKGCRRKALKQKSKIVSPVAMSETEDSGFSMQQGKVTNKKNTKRQKKVPHKCENYANAGDESPPSVPIREDKGKNSKSTLKRMRLRESSGTTERTTNVHTPLVEKQPEQYKKTDNPQPSVPHNDGKNQKPSVNSKTNRRNKEQTAKHPKPRQDALEGAWTDKELQKLNEAVNSLPKHKSGYWLNVSLVVGTRSAEECQKQFTALYQTHGRSKGKHKAKTSKTEPAKETALITAKVGTLKRKKQMWDFLDHLPRDDHDDIFAGSPMSSKHIKLPVWSTNGDELDFGHLQNPQTPSSSMFSSVKTPQCLHITPGMLRSVNRDNNDKYIYHLQKVKRQGNHGRKSSPKSWSFGRLPTRFMGVNVMDKFTPVPSVRKTKKRCVAEDDNFVVWNMLSDKDGPSMRGEEEEEEEQEDYFMDEY